MEKVNVEMSDDKDFPMLSELDLFVFIMQNGSKMIKVDRKCKHVMKFFTLDEDCLGFRYRPSAKKERIEINSIRNVSFTPNVNVTSLGEVQLSSENCFTIEFDDREPIVIVATQKRAAQCWVRGLSLLVKHKSAADSSLSPRKKWLFQKFDYYDKNHNGVIEFNELVQIMGSFNIPMTKQTLMTKFREFNTAGEQVGNNSGLSRTEFSAFFDTLSRRVDIEESVMKKYSSNGSFLTSQELLEFLRNAQGMEDATLADSERIIESHEIIDQWKAEKCLSIDGFVRYLLSEESDVFKSEHRKLYQDMNQPLCHYFISSSHNTYLEGDQLKGKASVEAYVSALKKGCRCVELDCWDGEDQEPVIYHGRTFVNKILFKDVIKAVDDYAFVASQYPLILSLENHCGVPAQKIMATYLKDIFGDKLYKCSVDNKREALPSPEFFKNKIIIKGKKLKSKGIKNGGTENETGEISEEEEDEAVQFDAEGNIISTEQGLVSTKEKKAVKKMKLAPELSSLVNYCAALRFTDFQRRKKEGKFYEMSSFAENKTRKFVKEKRSAFIDYNKEKLSRIYPGGSRIYSSNYNPQMAWAGGCQIVALNFQKEGEMMDLYLGKFNQNGNTGYVLKPEYMRNGDGKSSTSKPRNLVIKIISGQQFPKISGNEKGEIVDPYVVVAVYDIPEEVKTFKTKCIDNNGFNPCWNERFEFKVKNPEMALVKFTVYDYDIGSADDFIGQFSLPFTSVNQGYRHITLNGHGTKSIFPASLFVYIEIN